MLLTDLNRICQKKRHIDDDRHQCERHHRSESARIPRCITTADAFATASAVRRAAGAIVNAAAEATEAASI